MRNGIQLLVLSGLLVAESFEPARFESGDVFIQPRKAEGLDPAATDAAREWRFRPARRDGKAIPSVAYIVFGFREPVVFEE